MPLTESGAFGIWCGQSSCHVHRYQRSCVRLQGCHLLWTQVAASPIEAGHRHPIGDLRRVERLHARPGPNLAPSPAPAYPLPARRTRVANPRRPPSSPGKTALWGDRRHLAGRGHGHLTSFTPRTPAPASPVPAPSPPPQASRGLRSSPPVFPWPSSSAACRSRPRGSATSETTTGSRRVTSPSAPCPCSPGTSNPLAPPGRSAISAPRGFRIRSRPARSRSQRFWRVATRALRMLTSSAMVARKVLPAARGGA
jgi:hypothetical protein